MMKKSLFTVAVSMLVVLSLGLSACGAKSTSMKVVGSTSVGPLMKVLAAAYNKTNKISIDIEENGSSAGIKAAGDGTADVGMSSKKLSDAETSSGMVGTTICMDGIAVIVNKNNAVKALTIAQVKDIFTGKITNWKQVGGTDAAIVVVSRESGSGTRDSFEEKTGVSENKVSKLIASAYINNSTGQVRTTVGQQGNAIGYISIGLMDETVKSITLDGVAATEENVKNGTYAISRPFVLVTKGAPAGEAKKLIDWVMSDEGQAVVKSEKYVTMK